MQLDQMTQQNSALVEQSAAAADSMREQAQSLAQVVSLFRLGNEGQAPAPSSAPVRRVPAPVPARATTKAAAPATPARPRAVPAPARTPAAPALAAARKPAAAPAPAPAGKADDDWETF